jgi:hypothetical protein
MEITGIPTLPQAQRVNDSRNPHSCRHCADLVIDLSKLGWICTTRLKYGWWKSLRLLKAIGMTVSEASQASQHCPFFRNIMTRGTEHDISFQSNDEQLYWWLQQAPHNNGSYQVDITPLNRGLVESLDSVPFDIYAVQGTSFFPCGCVLFG